MLELFNTQYRTCAPYRQYVDLLGIDPAQVSAVEQIPFLPIQFFKTHNIYCACHAPEIVFTSSGTSANQTSRHPVASLSLYRQTFTDGFTHFYGDPGQWSIFALLPNYLERQGSSLVYMVEKLQAANASGGGFFLYDHALLHAELQKAIAKGEKIMLLGVSFALLDFATQYSLQLPENAVVMETGGMKGRHREIERTELHKILCNSLGVSKIHSEYGMCELLSQSYSAGDGIFECSPTMSVFIRNLQDPLSLLGVGQVGGINVIDLANRYSCSFIATGDRGVLLSDGRFEVLGRLVGQPLRGCNMLVGRRSFIV